MIQAPLERKEHWPDQRQHIRLPPGLPSLLMLYSDPTLCPLQAINILVVLHPQLERGVTDSGDFMKEMLVSKYKRKKKRKAPIEDRLQNFYDKVAELKLEEKAMSADLADWQNARKWTVITKGVEAESSDEEVNPLHKL